jgi:hypothetical protein
MIADGEGQQKPAILAVNLDRNRYPTISSLSL